MTVALSFSLKISRTLLSLADLELNDHFHYYIAEMGDLGISWNRQTTRSPWVDGEITVQRTRNIVEQRMIVEVLGPTRAELFENVRQLSQALNQDTFTLTTVLDGQTTQWRGEASDHMVSRDKERIHSVRARVEANVRLQPVALSGVY